MGIIGDHVSSTTGNAASAARKKEAIEKWNEAVEMIGHAVDKVGGDDPFKTFETVEQIKTLALALLNGVDYSTGQPTLGFAVPSSTPAAQQPVLALGGGSTQTQSPAPTDKSDEAKLGERIMKLTGQDLSRASVMVKFVEDAFGTDPNLLTYANQTAAALSRTTNPDELIQLPTGDWTLKSHQTKARKAGLYEDAFDELVLAVTGTNLTDPVGKELQRAKDEVNKLKSGTGTASKDDVTKLTELRTEIATALRIPRKGMDDKEWHEELVKGAAWYSTAWKALRKQATDPAGSFKLNSDDVDTMSVVEIAKAMIDEARKQGGGDNITVFLDTNGKAVKMTRNTGESDEDYATRIFGMAARDHKTFVDMYAWLKKLGVDTDLMDKTDAFTLFRLYVEVHNAGVQNFNELGSVAKARTTLKKHPVPTAS